MFDKSYVERLRLWRNFREHLENATDPINDTIQFWSKAPLVNIATDPYDIESWPDPWQMILNNEYCDFVKILAIFYTLQLTERFNQSQFEIHIVLDRKESAIRYLLFVDNQAIGYYNDKCIDKQELPPLQSQVQHNLLPRY